MSLEDDFASAKERVQNLPKRPTNDEMLKLYGLFKQATEGDATGSRPGLLQMVKRAKFDAWAGHKGTDKDAAKKAYIDLVASLEAKYA